MARLCQVFSNPTVMRPRICFLLNNLDEFNFEKMLYSYFPVEKYEVKVTAVFPENPNHFQLIVLWNYHRIIKDAAKYRNVVVIHSSDLPEGRGWAPIYHSFKEEKKEYVMSAILAATEVDAGDIIMRARFQIEDGYTASFVRELDQEVSLMMVTKILNQWPDGIASGIQQSGVSSYHVRRFPKDNEIDISKPLKTLLPHLRGLESNNPAYFFLNKVKYLIDVRPEALPNKPKKVLLEYPALNKVETWAGWA